MLILNLCPGKLHWSKRPHQRKAVIKGDQRSKTEMAGRHYTQDVPFQDLEQSLAVSKDCLRILLGVVLDFGQAGKGRRWYIGIALRHGGKEPLRITVYTLIFHADGCTSTACSLARSAGLYDGDVRKNNDTNFCLRLYMWSCKCQEWGRQQENVL